MSVDEFVESLHLLYRRASDIYCPSVAWLAKQADIPYETLRHFLKDPTHMLCPVNEEKMARALGRSSSYFRRVVERWKRRSLWKKKHGPAAPPKLCLGWGWLTGLEIEEVCLMEKFFHCSGILA